MQAFSPSRAQRWLLACTLALGASAVPLTAGPGAAIRRSTACADGTCCPEPGSECIINNLLTKDAYTKTAGGSCQKPPPETRPQTGR